jgi:phosphonate degradation associated HDIG domain protein
MPIPSSPVVDDVLRLFHERGGSNYGHEAVTQLQHALQAALFAEQSGASPELIVAALLHDVGHLLHDLPEDAPDRGVDDRHETRAAQWLRQRFGPGVVEPVAWHVAAKRYLCATDPVYANQLSPPSLQSLRLQGGPMTPEDCREFERRRGFREAVQLRRWDDAAKVVGLATPSLEHFVPMIDAVCLRTA